jgi:NitT/TauT family transport system substrate-binding protein
MTGPRRRRLSVILAAGVAAGVAACSSSSSTSAAASGPAPELSTITVDTLASDQSAGLWIAQQDGLFKQQGLTVKIAYVTGASAQVKDLDNHTALIAGANYINVFQAESSLSQAEVAAGDGFRIAADDVLTGTNTNDLMVAGNSPITSVAQLARKKVAFPSAGLDLGSLALDEQLKGYGIGPGSYTGVAMVYAKMAKALQTGKVAAAFVVQPYIAEMETKDGDHPLVDLMTGDMNTLPEQGWVTTAYDVQHYPRTVAAFQRAIAQAQTIAAGDTALVRKLLTENVKGLTPQVANIIAIRTFNNSPTVTELDRLAVAMQQIGALPTAFGTAKLASMILPLPPGS